MDTQVSFIFTTFLFIFSGVLVMIMAAGFAMLEAGLTRTKNNTTILVKNISLFSISSIMFYLIGYDLMYGSGNSFIGSGSFLSNVSLDTSGDYSGMSDFFFQVMFVATAASVISGTIAERMKIPAFLIFVVLLSGLIYPIQGHWTWGGSLTGEGALLEGFSDFAGSTIVHSVGGWAALAGVLLLGPRLGKYTSRGTIKPMPGSSIPLATLGLFFLWFGWFGFNGGSQLAMGTKEDVNMIALVVVNTHLAACSGLIFALITTYILFKKIDITMLINGALGGLVAVTAAPDVSVMYSIIVGSIGGIITVCSVIMFDKFKIDDPVGALSVHLMSGIFGTLAVGLTSKSDILTQLKGVVVIGGFVFITSLIIWFIISKTIGLRVEPEMETLGSDIPECGLEAYPEFRRL
jgi:Amt family ammonium transporter